MRFDQLKYFVAVAEELHFRRAAERLNVSQPPLSFQIKSLEAEFGIRLLNRTTRSVSLTEAGELLLANAKRILQSAEATEVALKSLARGELGILRIGFTISTSFHPFFYNGLQRYREAFPQVSLVLSEMLSGRQIDAILDSQIDVGFLRGQFGQVPGLTMLPLTADALVLAVPRSHPLAGQDTVALQDLRTEPFVCYPSNAGVGIYRQVLGLCARAGFEPRVIQEALEPSLILGLVAAGLGVAIVPSSLESIRIEGVKFLALDDPDAITTLYLCHRTDNVRSLTQAFVSLIGARAEPQDVGASESSSQIAGTRSVKPRAPTRARGVRLG